MINDFTLATLDFDLGCTIDRLNELDALFKCIVDACDRETSMTHPDMRQIKLVANAGRNLSEDWIQLVEMMQQNWQKLAKSNTCST